MMRKILVFVCALGMTVCGCLPHKPSPQQEEVVVDPADTALSKAAAEIQRDLRMLAESGNEGRLPGAVQSLGGTANYRFNGEIEDLVRDVGRNIGYNVDFSGKAPSQAIMVSVYTDGPKPWFDVLQSAGVQAGDRANISVNDVTKTITLSYDGIDANAPALARAAAPARTQAERNNGIVQARKGQEKAAQQAMRRPVTAEAKTLADLPGNEPKIVPVSSITVGQASGPASGIYPVGSPAPQVVPQAAQAVQTPPASSGAFRYQGGVLGAQKELGRRLGYDLRSDGPVSDMPVNIDVPSGAWQDVANAMNQQLRDASIFVDPANRLVVLRFWK